MIQNSNIKQESAIFNLFGDFTVGFARCDRARRVVVTKDDGGCMSFQANLKDLFRINNGPGYPAFGDLDFLNNPVSPVQ